MIPSIWAPGWFWILFPRIAALPRLSRMLILLRTLYLYCIDFMLKGPCLKFPKWLKDITFRDICSLLFLLLKRYRVFFFWSTYKSDQVSEFPKGLALKVKKTPCMSSSSGEDLHWQSPSLGRDSEVSSSKCVSFWFFYKVVEKNIP